MSEIEQRLIRIAAEKFVVLFRGFVVVMHHIPREAGVGVGQFARRIGFAYQDVGDGDSSFVAGKVSLQNGCRLVCIFGDDARTSGYQHQHHRYLILHEKIEQLFVVWINLRSQVIDVARDFCARRFTHTKYRHGIGGKRFF